MRNIGRGSFFFLAAIRAVVVESDDRKDYPRSVLLLLLLQCRAVCEPLPDEWGALVKTKVRVMFAL